MRKRSHPNLSPSGRSCHKFKRPHLVPTLGPIVISAHVNLNVLICKPEFGNYHHWAVQLDNLSTGDGTIFEVQGSYPNFQFTTYQCRRLYYPLKIIQTVCIKEFSLNVSAFAAICEAIENQISVEDQPVEWNCQDYVIEVLDMLADEWWLEEDEAEYITLRRKLHAMYGPIELVHKAVAAYPASPVSSIDQLLNGEDKTELDLADSQPQNICSEEIILDSDDG